MIERGGRRDVFLGTRECQAYVEPVKFGSGEGAYDNLGELSFGLMVHGLTTQVRQELMNFQFALVSQNGKRCSRFYKA